MAQCHDLHRAPGFGSIVKTVVAERVNDLIEVDPFESTIPQPNGVQFAVVYHVRSGSLEPGRRSAAYGMEEDELRKEQPHIYELLMTELSGLVIGYVSDGALLCRVPTHPPRLHSQIVEAGKEDYRLFATGELEFLPAMLNLADCPDVDDLVASTLRWIYQSSGDRVFLVRVAKELAELLRNDYDRLRRILNLLE